MKRNNLKISIFFFMVFMLGACGNSNIEVMSKTSENWEQTLKEQLKLLGHRNWVVVADAAYPLQSKSGITTVLSPLSHEETVKKVNELIADERHIQSIIHLDKEIDFVKEEDAPGIDAYKTFLGATLNAKNPIRELHEDIIKKLDGAASLYNVLIIKTDFTIPYTTVFFELDCAYWGPEKEEHMRELMKN